MSNISTNYLEPKSSDPSEFGGYATTAAAILGVMAVFSTGNPADAVYLHPAGFATMAVGILTSAVALYKTHQKISELPPVVGATRRRSANKHAVAGVALALMTGGLESFSGSLIPQIKDHSAAQVPYVPTNFKAKDFNY